MAQTFAQAQLTPMQLGGGEYKIPSIAALGQGLTGAADSLKQAYASKPVDPNSPVQGAQLQTTGTGMYVDPVTGALMIPGADGKMSPTQPAYNWNNDQTAVGSGAWRRVADPDWFRPDGGGR